MRMSRLVRILRIVLFAAAAVTVVTFVVMSLWNVLMPSIFAVRAISFWQALGLLLLSKLLFGGFRGYSVGGPRWRRRMTERWERMTPEERDRFRQGMPCGPGWRQEGQGPSRESEVRT